MFYSMSMLQTPSVVPHNLHRVDKQLYYIQGGISRCRVLLAMALLISIRHQSQLHSSHIAKCL